MATIIGRLINQSKESMSPGREPDDEWLTTFRSEASKRSSAEMKEAFGRILSGELQHPGTFSIRAVRNLGEMDTSTASLFRSLCNMTLVIPGVYSLVVTPGGDATQNALRDVGLPFSKLNILQEHDLIISDYNSSLDFAPFAHANFSITYAGRSGSLIAMDGLSKKVQIHGVGLSSIGEQLYKIVDLQENAHYTGRLAAHLETKKIGLNLG